MSEERKPVTAEDIDRVAGNLQAQLFELREELRMVKARALAVERYVVATAPDAVQALRWLALYRFKAEARVEGRRGTT